MLVALLLGGGFLAGQVAAWRQMAAAGVYLPTSPHSAFFFMMTGAHAVHVVAALVVLTWGAVGDHARRARIRGRGRRAWGCAGRSGTTSGAVWVLLFLLVSVY